jgi:hypothetical protein
MAGSIGGAALNRTAATEHAAAELDAMRRGLITTLGEAMVILAETEPPAGRKPATAPAGP